MASNVSAEKKRANGRGSVRRLPSGKWQWSAPFRDGEGKLRRKTGTEATQTKAEKALTRMLAEVDQGMLVAADRVTLQAWMDRWLADRKVGVAVGTYEQYVVYLRSYVPDHLKNKRLQDISIDDMRHLNQALGQRKLAASTRSKVFSLLRSVFESAIDLPQPVIRFNPAQRIKVRATVEEQLKRRQRKKALTHEELDRLLEAAKGDPLEHFIYTQFSLGMRRGECLGLRWQDVDFRAKTVRLEQQVKLEGNKAVVGSLKTVNADRVYPASDDLLEVLRERRRVQDEDRVFSGDDWQEHGLIFTTVTGTPIHPRNVNRSLDRLAKAAGIRHISSHVGRYTNITHRLMAGQKLEVVSKLAGHAYTSTTSDIYREVGPGELREAVYDLRQAQAQARRAREHGEK